MGCESKIYFCRKHLISAFERDYFSSEIIAMIDMRKMGYDDEVMKFRKLFNKDTDFGIYRNQPKNTTTSKQSIGRG